MDTRPETPRRPPGIGASRHRRRTPRGAPAGHAVPVALAALAVLGCGLVGCAAARGLGPGSRVQVGIASYYAEDHDGRRTASGEPFDMRRLTAAHPSLPFGTRVRVTHLGNGRAVVLRVNDRMASKGGRIIDVSYAAARRLGFVRQGLARVKVEVL